MSPKHAYVMYCEAILQSNERQKEITMRCKNHMHKPKPKPKPIQIKKKLRKENLPTTMWKRKMEGDRSDSEDGFLRSLSPTVTASHQISLFVLWMLSNLN